MHWLKRLFVRKETYVKPEMPEWKQVVEVMHDKDLDKYDAEVVNVLYSNDNAKRYVVLKNSDEAFSFSYEELYPFEEDEIMWTDGKPGCWPVIKKSEKAFASVDEAIKAIANEPLYETDFNKVAF